MIRTVGAAVSAAAVLAVLSGCSPTQGPLLQDYSKGEACAVADGRPTYVATQTIHNPSKQAVTVQSVVPAGHPNSRLRRTLSGPEMNGLLIVGGYDPTHGLQRLQPFEPTVLQPGRSMMVVFVSDVVVQGRNAAVQGVYVEYASGSQRYEGDIPWTYRFNAERCD